MISGVAFVGKSTLAQCLSQHLEFNQSGKDASKTVRLLSTNSVRDALCSFKSEEEDPIIHAYPYQCG